MAEKLFRVNRRWSGWLGCLAVLLVWVGNGSCVAAQTTTGQPPTKPELRIETGMHTAIIKRIATDAANRWLVTASDDKTARVWELAADRSAARLVRVLRPPIGAGDEGKLYAVALSPDGQTIAVGGWTGINGEQDCIYLFERESGRLVRRLLGLPNVINHLVFAPDGRYLAAALGGGEGVRVYDTTTWQLAGADKEYTAGTYGADFDAAGRLVTSCWDGYLRLYARPTSGMLRLLSKVPTMGGKQAFSVKFAPSTNGESERVAVGFNDTPAVEVYAGHGLQRLYAADTRGVDNGNLGSVAWSDDGAMLYAGGRYDVQGDHPIRVWSQGGRGSYRQVGASSDVVTGLLSLRGSGVAYSAGDPAFGVIGADGRRTLFTGPTIADYRNNREGFLLAEDGTELQFGYAPFGKSPARFKLNGRHLAEARGEAANLRAPLTESRELSVSDWRNNPTPKLNGQALKLSTNDMSRSLAITADSRRFLLGAERRLSIFDATGKELWQKPVPDVAWSVNLSGSGKLAVAAFGDGTIRWYRVTDGQELLAFFPHNDRQRWVLWTPTGYYDCSPGAEDLIGWHINNGKDAAADFFPASQFRSTYYRPDVIDLILTTLDEGQAVEQANLAANRRRETDLLARRPPIIQLLDPVEQVEARQSELTLRYRVRTPAGGAVTAVRVQIDSRPDITAKGQGRRVTGVNEAEGTVQVSLPPRDCVIELIADNANGASVPAVLQVKWRGTKPEDLFKPTLYVLAVGVNRYQSTELDPLTYAAKDARDFAAAWQPQKGQLYRDIVVKLLTDNDATKASVLAGFDWLANSVTSRDVAVVLLSGHGVTDRTGRNYFYMTSTSQPNNPISTAVSFADIRTVVENLPCKIAFFLDTCHAGNALGTKGGGVANLTEVINELASAENGAVVFASSTGRQRSLEKAEWQNGAFTKAVVEGLQGEADFFKDGRITLSGLQLFIEKRVQKLTNGQQAPVMLKPGQAPNYPLAFVIR